MLKFFKRIFKKDDVEPSVNKYNRLTIMRKSLIVEGLKDKAIFKTNLICSYCVGDCKDTPEKKEQEEQFFKFGRTICSSKIIKYHCIITVNDEINGETAYIAVEPFAVEELKKIANECNVLLEYIEDESRKYIILSSPCIGIREPQGNRVLTNLKELREEMF